MIAALAGGRRSLLFVYLNEQAANPDDDEAKLKNFGCSHRAALLSRDQRARSCPLSRADRFMSGSTCVQYITAFDKTQHKRAPAGAAK